MISGLLAFLINLKQSFSNYKDYLNLYSHDLTLNTTIIIYYFSFILNIDDKQGPAVGVTPVFTPINPSIFNSLFVFTHSRFLCWQYVRLNTLQENYFAATIFRNV